MKATDALGELLRLDRPVLETREAAARLDVPVYRASHILTSLEAAGLARRLRHGLWMLGPEVDAFSVPPYLTAPFPAYVSFWSALARHDMIEQVPRLIYVASPGRTRRITTTIGTYSVHHLAPELFGGYVGSASSGYLASPEKALFDVVYLRAARGGRVMLPEIELPDGFRADELEKWIARVARPRLRTLVARGIELVLTNAASPT